MAEEKKPEVVAAPSSEVAVPEAEKPAEKNVSAAEAKAEKEVSPPEAEKPAVAPVVEAENVAAEGEVEKKITQQVSFKEETYVVSELSEPQRKAVEELRTMVQEALDKRQLSAPPPPPPASIKEEGQKKEEVEADKKEEQPPSAEEKVAKEVTPHVADAAEPTASATEPPKTEEALKAKEAPKASEKSKTEEPPKVQEVPQPEATKKEDVEKIKETIVEEVSTTVVQEPPKEAKTTTSAAIEEPAAPVEPEEVSIWGIPLLADERSDVILLKFLRARDFKVKDAFIMLRNTVRWRKEFGVDELLDEDMGSDFVKVLFTHGVDKEGRVVCYNVFGEFQNKELSDAEKRKKFQKSLIQFVEKIVRRLDFSPKGINSFVLVNDLKNSPGYGKRDFYNKFLVILQDNYPEFVAKQVCINASWWYLAYNWIYFNVFTPRSKSKFVFASPSKTPETLFKYIAPEHVPIQYGGHGNSGETEFSSADTVTEVTIKPGSKHPIEFSFSEASELVWELRVIGWDVNYGAEFLPAKEGGYTLNISKPKKVTASDEPVLCDTFKVTEPGKIVLTIDNQSSKKKKLLYRSKVKTSV